MATPRFVSPGSRFVARFLAYTLVFRDHVQRLLKKETPKSDVILDLEVCQWKVGTKIIVHLEAGGLGVTTTTQEFVWNGKWEVIPFDVDVPSDAREGQVALKFSVAVGGVVIATIRPDIEIERQADVAGCGEELQVEIRSPRTAFASYASQDKEMVLARIRSIQICTQIDVFIDCLSLHPGDKWKLKIETEIHLRDIFLLFWSRPAKKSPWVDWEWRQALETKTIDGIQPHPLEPVGEVQMLESELS